MFERLMIEGEALAKQAVRRRRRALASALRAEKALKGAWVSENEDEVVLSGRGLARRFALDSELRWFSVRRLEDLDQGRRR
jgi:hypothetical protein